MVNERTEKTEKFPDVKGVRCKETDTGTPIILSIVIPAYNAEKYLEECLQSCFAQDIDPAKYEVLLINDGSFDRTMEIAAGWAEKHSNIRVISQVNKGLSIARNVGIEAASGKYIMFLDSDDYLVENSIGGIVSRCLKDNPDLLRFCAANSIDGTLERRFNYKDKGICPGKELLMGKFQVCATFALYKKDFLSSIDLRFYPGIYHEDNEFTPRAYYLAESTISVDELVYIVRQNPESISRTPNIKRGHDLLKIVDILTDFAENQVEEEYRAYIYKQISDCINWCIRLLNTLSDNDGTSLYRTLLKKKNLFSLMLKSSNPNHRIEGTLLKLFPKRMKSIYNTLDIIHR